MDQVESDFVKIASTVIISAGNARALAYKALDLAEEGKFDEAKQCLEEAQKEITVGHTAQTEFIHAEARGEGVPITVLLVHAQDSLMVAMSEVQLIKRIIRLFQNSR